MKKFFAKFTSLFRKSKPVEISVTTSEEVLEVKKMKVEKRKTDSKVEGETKKRTTKKS